MAPHAAVAIDLPDTDAAIGAGVDLTGAAATPLAMAPPDGSANPTCGRSSSRTRGVRPDGAARPDGRGAPHLVLARPLRHERGQGARTVPDVPPAPHRAAHATGNFADLLRAVAHDPAMLVYLDGITNSVAERNENFGRECSSCSRWAATAATPRTTWSPRRVHRVGGGPARRSFSPRRTGHGRAAVGRRVRRASPRCRGEDPARRDGPVRSGWRARCDPRPPGDLDVRGAQALPRARRARPRRRGPRIEREGVRP